MADLDADFEAELRRLLAKNLKLEAVKRYRERTGLGLAESKAAVEAIEQGGKPAGGGGNPANELEVLALLKQGQKIEAIKLYRQQTGLGLKEAKTAVESLAAKHGLELKSGCLGVVVFVLIALAGAAAYAGWHG